MLSFFIYFYIPFIFTLNGKGCLHTSHSKYFVLKYIVQPFIFLYIFDDIHYYKHDKCIYSQEPFFIKNFDLKRNIIYFKIKNMIYI